MILIEPDTIRGIAQLSGAIILLTFMTLGLAAFVAGAIRNLRR